MPSATGSFNTFLGSQARPSLGDLINASAIGANAVVSQNNSLILGNNANVGIGTSSPFFKLSVLTAPGNYGLVHSDTFITVGSYVGGSSSGATGGWLGTLTNNKLFFFTNSGQPTMTVDTTGSIGIGTTAPKAKLDVTGGNILVGSPGQGIVLKSPNGATCRLLSIDNAGAMVLTAIVCP